MKAVLASNNKHKLQEIRAILADKFEYIYSLSEMNIDIDIEETAVTFEENALIKARAIVEMTGMMAIADDSGLCVAALNGEPGVYSARYAGEPCNDDANNQLLLNNLRELEKTNLRHRKAYFMSVVVLCRPDGTYECGRGHVEGEIIDDYRGENGFGYDPIFYCNQLEMTFAQADMESKNKVSHRARALNDLISKIWKL